MKTHLGNPPPAPPNRGGLAREGKLISEDGFNDPLAPFGKGDVNHVARDFRGKRSANDSMINSEPLSAIDNRRRKATKVYKQTRVGVTDMVKTVTNKIAALKRDLEELNQFAQEGIDISKVANQIREQLRYWEGLL